MSDLIVTANQLLIAMPTLADPNFARTVTLICEHSDEGTLGIVINRPTELQVGDVFEQLELDRPGGVLEQQPVMNGGPIAPSRGFVLHPGHRDWESTLKLDSDLQLTTSRDIMVAMAAGDGPSDSLFALGYAGWGPGQLEAEIKSNAWLNVDCDIRLLFATPIEDRWESATQLLGIDPSSLSPEAGHS